MSKLSSKHIVDAHSLIQELPPEGLHRILNSTGSASRKLSKHILGCPACESKLTEMFVTFGEDPKLIELLNAQGEIIAAANKAVERGEDPFKLVH
jgi:hypothetical protein